MKRALVIIVVGACSAYDGDLGQTPFLCGPTEPRCPDNYTCMTDLSGKDVCYVTGGPFICADDSAHEPNETIASATMTPVDTMKSYQLNSLAICPSTDVDIFAITLATANETITATITYQTADVALSAGIQNASGATIVSATAVSGMTNVIRAVAPTQATGKYYVQVSGPNASAASQNNYSLMIGVTP